jgi:hypothetical protein
VSTSRPIGLGALEFYSSKASAAGFGAREIALLWRRYRQNQSVPAGNGPSNIFVSGQPAVIKSQLAFPGAGGSLALAPSGCLPADDLRQPEQQGAGWRWRQSHNQSVRPTIRMRRCRRLPVPKCRLAPSAGAKFTVSYQAVALALSYMNWAASPSSTEAVRPPPRCWRAMLIIRSSASSVTWSRHEEADPPVRASVRRALARCHFVRNATCLLRHVRAVSGWPIRLEQAQVGRVFRYDHSVLPLRVARRFFGSGVGWITVGSLTTCRAGPGRRS